MPFWIRVLLFAVAVVVPGGLILAPLLAAVARRRLGRGQSPTFAAKSRSQASTRAAERGSARSLREAFPFLNTTFGAKHST